MHTNKLTVGRWYVCETLSKDDYSWTKKGYDKDNGTPVRLKFIIKPKEPWSETETKRITNHLKSLKQVNHKNVIKLYCHNLNTKYPSHEVDDITQKLFEKEFTINQETDIDVILLVYEYGSRINLTQLCFDEKQLPKIIARTYFHQIIDGLQACHECCVVHKNIKVENFVLDSKFNIKIADYGLSTVEFE